MSLGDEVIEKKAEKSATKNPFKFEEESKNEPETKKIEKSLPLDASKLKNVSGFGSDDIGCTDSPGQKFNADALKNKNSFGSDDMYGIGSSPGQSKTEKGTRYFQRDLIRQHKSF